MTGVRLALGLLALFAAAVGVPAAFVPRRFYDDFPFLASWVDLLPPYNKHLITDVGELYLAFAVLFVWAVARPTRALVIPLCIAWTVTAALHLRFHVTHLGGFGTADAITQTVLLALVVLLPLAVLVGMRQPSRTV
jgi:hypothetical protein